MRTKIIPRFRIIKRDKYKPNWDTIQPRWWGGIVKWEQDFMESGYVLQEKRRFWFGYKDLEFSGFKEILIDKLRVLQEIYGKFI